MPIINGRDTLCGTIEKFFAMDVRVVDVRELDEDSRDCSICLSTFRSATDFEPTTNDDTSDIPEEAIQVIRCGHVFGRACLYKYATSRETNCFLCPLCHGPLFHPIAADRNALTELKAELERRNDAVENAISYLNAYQNGLRELEELAEADEAMIQEAMAAQQMMESLLATCKSNKARTLGAIAQVEANMRGWESMITEIQLPDEEL